MYVCMFIHTHTHIYIYIYNIYIYYIYIYTHTYNPIFRNTPVVSSALTWISSSGSNSARDPLIASRMAAVRQPEKKREACR